MFEIPDDDDGFWEKLPLDEVGLEMESEIQPNPSTSSSSSIALKKGVSNITRYPSSLTEPPLTNSSNNKNNSNALLQANRSQLAQIHNVLNSNSNRTWDHTCSASSNSAVIATNGDIPSKNCQVEEDAVQYKPGSKRKFPGPAGILPESLPKLHHDSPVLIKDSASNKEVLPSSQPSPACDPFSSAPWLSLVADIGSAAKSVLNKFAIRSMLIKACKRVLPKGKIPLVLAFVDSVEFHGCDGTAVLKDPSGKVHGALHNDLVKDPSTALKAGWVIVLRQTSVISPTPRTHYLNITPANIVVIYSQTKGSHDIHKSPWSPMASLQAPISPSLPPLHQIIQESDDELKMAANYPQTPQHAISRLDAPRTPNSSPISLFGSVSNNSPSLHLQPAHSFPSPESNTPVYRQFKSPHISHTAPRPMDPPSYRQVINPCHSNNNNTCVPQNRFSSTHSLGNANPNPYHNQPSTNARHNVSFPSKYTHQQQRFPSSVSPSLSSGPNPRVSNKQAVQTKSMVQDDFLDDDSDLLSLCEDAEMISTDIMTLSNHTNSKSMTAVTPICKNDAAVNSSKSGTHLNFAFEPNTSESLLRKYDGINSAFQKAFSENGRHPSTVQQGRIGFSSKPTTTKQLDNNSLKVDDCSTGEKGDRRTGYGGDDVGGRDARIQLGVSNPPPQQQQEQHSGTAERALGFCTWDDDLDDELLSQL